MCINSYFFKYSKRLLIWCFCIQLRPLPRRKPLERLKAFLRQRQQKQSHQVRSEKQRRLLKQRAKVSDFHFHLIEIMHLTIIGSIFTVGRWTILCINTYFFTYAKRLLMWCFCCSFDHCLGGNHWNDWKRFLGSDHRNSRIKYGWRNNADCWNNERR